MLGCCSRFKECSDLGRCVHENSRNFHGLFDYNKCLYKENLDMGKNFYTEYNENNKRRAEEYKDRIKEEREKNQLSLEELNEAKNTKNQMINRNINKSFRTYIQIPNRLFHIGRRSSYGACTYDLKQEDKEELIEKLKDREIEFTSIENEELFIDENIENNEYCNYRVVLTIDDKKYNISNYNCRGLRRETAVKIASYLFKKGVEADLEIISGFSGNRLLKNIGNKEKAPEVRKEDTKNKEEKPRQLSLFEMQYIA